MAVEVWIWTKIAEAVTKHAPDVLFPFALQNPMLAFACFALLSVFTGWTFTKRRASRRLHKSLWRIIETRNVKKMDSLLASFMFRFFASMDILIVPPVDAKMSPPPNALFTLLDPSIRTDHAKRDEIASRIVDALPETSSHFEDIFCNYQIVEWASFGRGGVPRPFVRTIKSLCEKKSPLLDEQVRDKDLLGRICFQFGMRGLNGDALDQEELANALTIALCFATMLRRCGPTDFLTEQHRDRNTKQIVETGSDLIERWNARCRETRVVFGARECVVQDIVMILTDA